MDPNRIAMDPNRIAAAPNQPDGGGRRPGAHALRLVPLFWRRNGAHGKIERWAGHRSLVAASRWRYATTNQTMVPMEGGALERRCKRAEGVGEDMYPSFRAGIRVTKK
jgi:hypothetical protein